MLIHRPWRGLFAGAALCAVAAAPARADFYRNLALGLSALAAPGAPSGQRNGFFRVAYEPIPRGWRADWQRSFGPDAFGRPNSIDLGGARLVLNDGTVEMRVQQFSRFTKGIRYFSSTPEPISYSMELNTGVQDTVVSGTLAYAQNFNMNTLGFYDLSLNISNRGESQIDGFALVDEQTLDFDVGPINVSGNIFADILAAATEPMFSAAGVQNPFAKFSGRATREAIVNAPIDELRAKVERGETVTEAELQAVAEATFLASVLRVSLPDLEFLETADVEIIIEDPLVDVIDEGTDPFLLTTVPEPATLTFIILPAAAMVLSRRRRQRA